MEMESKIEGLMIATAKVAWMDAEKKADSGYQFAPTKSGFEIKVEQAVLEKHSVAMDALHDCVKQLEEMSEEELKKAVGYRPDQGPLNTGLVIVSKVDPRVSASVTIGDANDKTIDLVIQWYVAHPQDTAREVKDDEMKHVEQIQKETPEMELDEIEKILGLDMKAESTTLVDKIKTTKSVANDLDSYGLQLEEEFKFPVEKPKAKVVNKKPVQEAALFEGFDGWGLPTVIEEASKKSIGMPLSEAKAVSKEELKAAYEKAKSEYRSGVRYYDEKHNTFNPASYEENILEHVSDLVGYYGVEAYDPNDSNPTHPRFLYVNSGDSYNLTIVYDSEKRVFSFTDIGSIIEKYMDSGDEELDESITGKSESAELGEMARKVTDEVAAAFKEGKSKKVRNTHTDGKSVFLHGNEIVKKDGSKVMISDAGWPTVTTRERINGVLATLGISAKVSQKAGKQMVNGKEWDGKWMEVGSMAAEAVESVEAPAKKSAISREVWMKKHGKTEEAKVEATETNESKEEAKPAVSESRQRIRQQIRARMTESKKVKDAPKQA